MGNSQVEESILLITYVTSYMSIKIALRQKRNMVICNWDEPERAPHKQVVHEFCLSVCS